MTDRPTATWSADLFSLMAEIMLEHNAVGQAHRSGLEHGRLAGEKLIQLRTKIQIRHGQWLPFLSTHCPGLAPRTAQGYMKLAKHWSVIQAELNARGGAHLTIHEALRLLGVPQLDDDESRSTRAPKAAYVDTSPAEQRELRRIAAELESFPFISKTFNFEAGPRRGGDVNVTGGAAGAPVFWDIVGGDPKVGQPTFPYTRSSVLQKICAFLDAGHRRSVVSDLAVDVARRRLAGDRTLRAPVLPPEAEDIPDARPHVPFGTQDEWAEFVLLLAEFHPDFGPDVRDMQIALIILRQAADKRLRAAEAA